MREYEETHKTRSQCNRQTPRVNPTTVPHSYGAQGLGQIVGPNIAASLLGAGHGYTAVFAMCAMAALAGMTVYGVMYLKLRQRIPALADAA